MKVTTPEGTYSLNKRYSEFEAFYKSTKKDLGGVSFPGKGGLFGAPSPAQRTVDLNKFMEAVCSRPMPADSSASLKTFVANTGSAGAVSSPAKPPAAPST